MLQDAQDVHFPLSEDVVRVRGPEDADELGLLQKGKENIVGEVVVGGFDFSIAACMCASNHSTLSVS